MRHWIDGKAARAGAGIVGAMAFLCLAGAGLRVAAQASPHNGSGYLPQRVYEADHKRFTDFEAMLQDLARADVVFVGEQHDDPATHRVERAVLEGLARRRVQVTLAMEMFERDTQGAVDAYFAGTIGEEEFLKTSRPWPRYATDYRPLVEFAKAHGWKLVASNVPRRIASQFSKKGLEAQAAMPEADRKLLAAELKCLMDDYFKRFVEVMSEGHPGSDGKSGEKKAPDPKQEAEQKTMVERFYYAQCVKDETMGESIAAASGRGGKGVVVHYNGAFHSDYRLGTAARAARRLPGARVRVVSVVPVDDFDAVKAEDYRKQGDYIVFVLKPKQP